MNDIDRIGAAHITAAPFISCLVRAREATQALVKYTELIEHLAGIRAQTLRRAENRAPGPLVDDELLGFNVHRVERFESPLRLMNLARFSQVTGVPMSSLLKCRSIPRLSIDRDRPAPDMQVAAYRIRAGLDRRLRVLKLSRTAAAERALMDKHMVLRLFRNPEEGRLFGPNNRPVYQLWCALLPLGLDLADTLRRAVPGEPAPASHLTSAL